MPPYLLYTYLGDFSKPFFKNIIFFSLTYYIGIKTAFLHRFSFQKATIFPSFFRILTRPLSCVKLISFKKGGHLMNDTENTLTATEQRKRLLALCRFLSARICYRFMLILLSVTGIILTVCGQSQFAPYGIALVCLILPAFLAGSSAETTKKENSDFPLSVLYRRYHYSPSVYNSYRISLILGMLLLFIWHQVQSVPVTLCGISAALLYLTVNLALYPVLSRILYVLFHCRLMNGRF